MNENRRLLQIRMHLLSLSKGKALREKTRDKEAIVLYHALERLEGNNEGV